MIPAVFVSEGGPALGMRAKGIREGQGERVTVRLWKSLPSSPGVCLHVEVLSRPLLGTTVCRVLAQVLGGRDCGVAALQGDRGLGRGHRAAAWGPES